MSSNNSLIQINTSMPLKSVIISEHPTQLFNYHKYVFFNQVKDIKCVTIVIMLLENIKHILIKTLF